MRALRELSARLRTLTRSIRRGGRQSLDEALRLIRESDDPEARRGALERLRLAPPDAQVVEALIHALGDGHPFVRQRTVEICAELPGEAIAAALREAARSRSPTRRAAAIEALGLRRDPESLEVAASALRSRNALVRWSAAETLARLNSPEALEHLLRVVDDENWGVRRAAALAIKAAPRRESDGEELPSALGKLAADPHPAVRAVAAEALGRFRTEASESLLLKLLEDPDLGVRSRAARALGKVGTAKALEALRLLRGDSTPALSGQPLSALASRAMRSIKMRLFLARIGIGKNGPLGRSSKSGRET